LACAVLSQVSARVSKRQQPILVAAEDRFATIASVHDVVNRAWILNSELSRHPEGEPVSAAQRNVSVISSFSQLPPILNAPTANFASRSGNRGHLAIVISSCLNWTATVQKLERG